MGNLSQKHKSSVIKIVGADVNGTETYFADVELKDGKYRLLTDAVATIEQVFGFDNQADVWFSIGTFENSTGIGNAATGATFRIRIAAGDQASLFPAIDLTYTVTAADVASATREITVAQNIVNMLNADGTFSVLWKASRVKDDSVIHISSKLFAEFGERRNSGDFLVTTTGDVTALAAYDKIIRRGKQTALSRDPRDKRIGILGITGEVTTIPGAIGDLYIENAKTVPGGSASMNVNGSVTPVEFFINPDAVKDIFIRELRFYGGANGIKFGQFMAQNNPLTNGLEITIRSDNEIQIMPLIKSTEDFKNKWAFGGGGPGASFRIDVQAGGDQMIAAFIFETPFAIRRTGTFTIDDYVKIRVRDNLTAGLSSLELLGFGFLREV